MSGLAHFLEDEGIATTGISLVREHTEGYRPPRFLWVPFPLGRPFGVPNNTKFQHEVLAAALALFECGEGPVLLEDFPHDAPLLPASVSTEETWSCPVNFAAPPTDPNDQTAALTREIEQLSPWYEISLNRRGRSSVGASGLDIEQSAAFVAGFLADTWPQRYRDDMSLCLNLKLACEDLKTWYQEAVMAQPGAPDPQAIANWLWGETTLGRVFLGLAEGLAASQDQEMCTLAQHYFVPRTQSHRKPS
ncbi:MAG: hypothetical protein GKR89_29910 [Candidatus Latescibacteria bacterium]|nr:hypothetical protein [Candidatus Latescibacterota bacterium]